MNIMKSDSGPSLKSKTFNRFYKIAIRLPVLMIGLAIVASSVVAFLSYNNANQSLTAASKRQLILVAQARRDALADKLQRLESDIRRLVDGQAMQVAMTDMLASMDTIDLDREIIAAYFQAEGTTPEQRLELKGEEHEAMYSWDHAKVHPDFASSLKAGGYADILITDARACRF